MNANDEIVALGYSPDWQSRFDASAQPDDPAGTQIARVVRQDRGAVMALTVGGVDIAYLNPVVREAAVVGDWVAVADQTVVRILRRDSLLVRRDAHADAAQPIVANVDLVLIVCGLDRPMNQRRVERAITQTRQSGAEPLIVLTKSDLGDDTEVAADLHAMKVDTVTVSAFDSSGRAELESRMKGTTSVLIGESGAGKSSLLNALLGEEVVETGEVRSKDAKGRHTTTRRELHITSFGVVIDTPGVRGLGLWADEDSIGETFPDLTELAEECRFSDCNHDGEPGCAIAAGIAEGTVDPKRVEAWQIQVNEVRDNEQRKIEAIRRAPEKRPGKKGKGRGPRK